MRNFGEHILRLGLSKTSFLRGKNCAKSLYLHKYRPDLRDETTDSQQAVFVRGTEVGLLARNLFPGGIDACRTELEDLSESLRKTEEAISAGAEVIYEAAFQFDGIYVAVDILVKEKRAWRAYEVKSATKVKDEHLDDAAIQYYVLRNAGVRVSDIFVVHLNTTYVRRGNLRLKSLFSTKSVLKEAKKRQKAIPAEILELRSMLSKSEAPSVDIGPHCSTPYRCDFQGHCWGGVPIPSVFDITHIGKKAYELYNKGIQKIEDVPDDFRLSASQRIQVEAHKSGQTVIDKDELSKFLSILRYPLHFVDFETIYLGVPIYNESKPYQQIVFQFSLHIKESPASELKHVEFLADPGPDPRPEFVKQFLRSTKGRGSIVVYNKSFEGTRLTELGRDFPKYARELEKRCRRMVDLMAPFRGKDYYDPKMNGSYSIKDVLPVVVPGLSYDGLQVAEGGEASRLFLQMIEGTVEDGESVRKVLKEYCGMDTLAMVSVSEALNVQANS